MALVKTLNTTGPNRAPEQTWGSCLGHMRGRNLALIVQHCLFLKEVILAPVSCNTHTGNV